MALTPGKVNFKLKQGSTWDPVVTWLPGGVAMDLTGWTARMQLRPAPQGTPVYNVTCNIPTPLTGQIYLVLEANETDLIPEGHYKYDLELVHPRIAQTDEVRCILEGSITVKANITI